MIAAAGNRKDDLLKIIVDLARSKLLCQNDIDVSHLELGKKAGATAVVDLRLMLDYETRREAAREAEVELVASHMRMAFSVPQRREYLRSAILPSLCWPKLLLNKCTLFTPAILTLPWTY
jgi:hypothetical protein